MTKRHPRDVGDVLADVLNDTGDIVDVLEQMAEEQRD